MKTSLITRRTFAVAFGAFALLGTGLASSPVRAQDAAAPAATAEPTKAISLNLVNVAVQASLRTLFTSAGIRNYIIDSDVQGFANINVNDVPFSLALRQLLSSVNPPLTYDVENGTYHVKVQRATAPPAPTINPPAIVSPDGTSPNVDPNAPKRFYRIPIDKYDAFIIASLLGAQGIVDVPVNTTRDSGSGGGTGGGAAGNRGFGSSGGGPNVSTVGGNNGGFGGRSNGGGYSGGGSSFGGSTGGGFRSFALNK